MFLTLTAFIQQNDALMAAAPQRPGVAAGGTTTHE
jgi:hypothetical protein